MAGQAPSAGHAGGARRWRRARTSGAVVDDAFLIPYAAVVTREIDPDSVKADSAAAMASRGIGEVNAAVSGYLRVVGCESGSGKVIHTASGLEQFRADQRLQIRLYRGPT